MASKKNPTRASGTRKARAEDPRAAEVAELRDALEGARERFAAAAHEARGPFAGPGLPGAYFETDADELVASASAAARLLRSGASGDEVARSLDRLLPRGLSAKARIEVLFACLELLDVMAIAFVHVRDDVEAGIGARLVGAAAALRTVSEDDRKLCVLYAVRTAIDELRAGRRPHTEDMLKQRRRRLAEGQDADARGFSELACALADASSLIGDLALSEAVFEELENAWVDDLLERAARRTRKPADRSSPSGPYEVEAPYVAAALILRVGAFGIRQRRGETEAQARNRIDKAIREAERRQRARTPSDTIADLARTR